MSVTKTWIGLLSRILASVFEKVNESSVVNGRCHRHRWCRRTKLSQFHIFTTFARKRLSRMGGLRGHVDFLRKFRFGLHTCLGCIISSCKIAVSYTDRGDEPWGSLQNSRTCCVPLIGYKTHLEKKNRLLLNPHKHKTVSNTSPSLFQYEPSFPFSLLCRISSSCAVGCREFKATGQM